MPVWGEQDESVEGCCCSAGNVQARLTLAKTGYVPGEPITYTVDIFNKCDSTIERVELELKQVGLGGRDHGRGIGGYLSWALDGSVGRATDLRMRRSPV